MAVRRKRQAHNRGAFPPESSLPRWKLEDAKARFSELVRVAREAGPQRVTVYGKDAVVVLSAEEFERMCAPKDQRSLRDLLVNSPLRDLDFGEEGVKSPVREVEL